MKFIRRLAPAAVTAVALVIAGPVAAEATAATTTVAAANPCATHGISLRQGSFDYIECHYDWGVRVTGKLRNNGYSGCVKVEVNFDNGAYRYKTKCSGSGSVDINWSEGGTRDAYVYLSYSP
ncbi:hypothetical protein SAMN04487983_1001477 [Streptomyces sp. yr375]|uniref:hypothetical protein n=1 Tax=Streptomyces sp. yr375 TaxID=1761906 RepID=UPI0008ABC864|nr:hypothetical protein [Streptomyces sp. yr375]SEP77642.1 hypothetical protein SAMN04487983_1001477 [Streptomyces sp. yr375]